MYDSSIATISPFIRKDRYWPNLQKNLMNPGHNTFSLSNVNRNTRNDQSTTSSPTREPWGYMTFKWHTLFVTTTLRAFSEGDYWVLQLQVALKGSNILSLVMLFCKKLIIILQKFLWQLSLNISLFHLLFQRDLVLSKHSAKVTMKSK